MLKITSSSLPDVDILLLEAMAYLKRNPSSIITINADYGLGFEVPYPYNYCHLLLYTYLIKGPGKVTCPNALHCNYYITMQW